METPTRLTPCTCLVNLIAQVGIEVGVHLMLDNPKTSKKTAVTSAAVASIIVQGSLVFEAQVYLITSDIE